MLATPMVVLLFLSLADGGIVKNQSSRSPGPARSTSAFTDVELQCFAEEKVLHSDGKCYKLRQKGPCREEQWLVFDKDETIVPDRSNKLRLVCKNKPCTSTTKPLFWPEDGQCHKLSDKSTLCRYKGTELRSDSFGDGECACAKTFCRFEQDVLRGRNTTAEWEGDCYPLYHRGPCPARKLLVPALLEGFGLVGRCFDDYCHRLNAAEPGSAYVMHKADNTCYKLGSVGRPCAAEESFNIHPVTKQPQCISRVNSVFSGGDVRCGGENNINRLSGECRKEVMFKAQSFGFETTRKKRARRRATN